MSYSVVNSVEPEAPAWTPDVDAYLKDYQIYTDLCKFEGHTPKTMWFPWRKSFNNYRDYAEAHKKTHIFATNHHIKLTHTRKCDVATQLQETKQRLMNLQAEALELNNTERTARKSVVSDKKALQVKDYIRNEQGLLVQEVTKHEEVLESEEKSTETSRDSKPATSKAPCVTAAPHHPPKPSPPPPLQLTERRAEVEQQLAFEKAQRHPYKPAIEMLECQLREMESSEKPTKGQKWWRRPAL